MADSSVVITSGTGTNIDTRTEATNGHHRQVIIIGDPATNAGVAPVDATAGLKVDLGTDNDITGTVTANAGTNLNTSTLALEAGGNLASIKAKTDNIPALGQALAAASVPVILPSATITTLTPPSAITNFANETGGNLASIKTNTDKIPSQGQALAAASLPVVLTAAQVTTLTPPAAITGFATETTLGSVKTAVETLDNAIAGSEMQVDVVGALPAGSALIGKVSIDQVTANANEVVTKTGSVTAATLSAETTKVIGTVNIASAQTLATVTTVGSVTAITNALPAGTNAIGKLSANSGVDIGDVDVTSIAAGTNKIGDVDIAPRTTGGWLVGNFTSGDTYTALTGTAQVIKGSAGKFGGYYIYNPNATATYVMIYNIAAASVTVGTSTPKLVFCIPATGGANLELLAGIPFDTAMSIAATTTGGGNTAPTTALEAMIFYV